jgi:AraC family transcriptional regulator of adaptative response/methylated-DNA-[protein]-cysteine methyltransferase
VALAELQRQWAPARLSQDATGAKRLAAEIFAATAKDMRLHLCGSVFQLQVWTALLRIRPGYYVGYGDLAREIGAPRASRAVGQAVGANRVALLVPCHRVLAAGGRIGGFRWGTALKRAMLEQEASALASDFT